MQSNRSQVHEAPFPQRSSRLRKRMSAAEHEAVARRLLYVMQEMAALGKLLLPIYGASSRIGRLSERLFTTGARTDADTLRCILDDAWYEERHERDAPNPYYGPHAREIMTQAKETYAQHLTAI